MLNRSETKPQQPTHTEEKAKNTRLTTPKKEEKHRPLTLFPRATQVSTHIEEIKDLGSIALTEKARKSLKDAMLILKNEVLRKKLTNYQLCSLGAQYTEAALYLLEQDAIIQNMQSYTADRQWFHRMLSMQPTAALFVLNNSKRFATCNLALITNNLVLEYQTHLTDEQYKHYSQLTPQKLIALMINNLRLAILIIQSAELANKFSGYELYNLIIQFPEQPTLALTILKTPELAAKLHSSSLHNLALHRPELRGAKEELPRQHQDDSSTSSSMENSSIEDDMALSFPSMRMMR